MNLELQQLLPVPLKERMQTRTSGIWLQDLTVSPGERLFIQAPSGTGKTTLTHMLYGLRTDFSGKLSWGGKDISSMSSEAIASLRAKDISIIFQDLRLFPELTAWENLELKRALTNTVSMEEVSAWMERLGVAGKKDSLAKTLSYGERQRIAIIRALLQPFKWLLMDEPFSHLDKANIDKASALIDEVVRRNGATLVLADLDENHYFDYTKTLYL